MRSIQNAAFRARPIYKIPPSEVAHFDEDLYATADRLPGPDTKTTHAILAMAQQGATLQNYNNELVKCIEDLREKREEVNRTMLKDEEEKAKIQKVRVNWRTVRCGHWWES
jgi:hypothetical protein